MLVILAILALIVTPLVLNIIKKATTAADKRSIDAYGRSIELAIADYLLDKGHFPTSIEQLTIEYTGDKVECATTLKEDGSVYLAECTVSGREVTGYTYGKEDESSADKSYSIGDEVTYNNVDYYVIKDSDETESSVTLLKAELLTYQEVQTYSAGTGAYISDNNGVGDIHNYETSHIKATVDAWKEAQAPEASEARLITKEEYEALCDIEIYETPTEPGKNYVPQYNWIYIRNYMYWTMSPTNDSVSDAWSVAPDGDLVKRRFVSGNGGTAQDAVRPVIVIDKSLL